MADIETRRLTLTIEVEVLKDREAIEAVQKVLLDAQDTVRTNLLSTGRIVSIYPNVSVPDVNDLDGKCKARTDQLLARWS